MQYKVVSSPDMYPVSYAYIMYMHAWRCTLACRVLQLQPCIIHKAHIAIKFVIQVYMIALTSLFLVTWKKNIAAPYVLTIMIAVVPYYLLPAMSSP